MPKRILAYVAVIVVNGAYAGLVEANAHGSMEHQVFELHARATKALQVGLYSDGIEFAQSALRLASVHLGADHPGTLQNKDGLASLYFEQGRYAEAETLRVDVLQRRLHLLGDDHNETLESKNGLAEVYRKQARYDEAESLYWQLLRSRRQTLGNEHPDSIHTMVDLGELYAEQGRHGDAESIVASIRQSLKSDQQHAGSIDPERPQAMHYLAHLYWHLERFQNAERLMSKAQELYQDQLSQEHLDVLHLMAHRAALFDEQGRYDKSEQLYRDVLELYEQRLGESHRDTLGVMRRFGAFYSYTGRYKKAEQLLARALKLHRGNLGDQHSDTILCINSLADVYIELERYDDAEALYKEVLSYRRRHVGADHPDVFLSLEDMIWLYDSQGLDQASDLILVEAAELLQRRRVALDNGDPETLGILHDLGSRYRERQRYDEAERLLTDALQYRRERLGRHHPDTLDSAEEMARLHEDLGRNAEALNLLSSILEQREKSLGPHHPDTIRIMQSLGWMYFDQGLYERARTLFARSLQSSRNAFGRHHATALDGMASLASVHIVQDRHGLAIPLIREILRLRQETLEKDHVDVLNAMEELGFLYLRQGRFEDAEDIILETIDLHLGKFSESNQYRSDDLKYLSKLLLQVGNIPGERGLLIFLVLTIIPALAILFWLSRSAIFDEAGRIVWTAALAFAPLIIVVGKLNSWASPYFLEIDNAWIASLRAFVQVAVIEEISKLVVVVAICWFWSLQQRALAVIACGLAVGVSFGALENLGYAYDYGLYTSVLRLATSLPGHMVDSGCAAGFLALAWRYPNDRWRYRFLAILVPVMLHGSYDYLLFVDDRVAADLGIISRAVAVLVVAIGAAILTLLIALHKQLRDMQTEVVVARSYNRRYPLSVAYLSLTIFGLIIAANVLSDFLIASYAALRTLQGSLGFQQISEFPMGDILSVLLRQKSIFAELVIEKRSGVVVPLSGIELALIPIVAAVVIVSCILLFQAIWRSLVAKLGPS